MPFPWRVQPIEANGAADEPTLPLAIRQVPKYRLHRLFERQFSFKNVANGEDQLLSSGGSGEFEPSSICLRKMVQDYMEDEGTNNGKPQRSGGRNRYNCFSGSGTDSSDDEDSFSSREALRRIKRLVSCANTSEKILVEKAKEFVVEDDEIKPEDDTRLQTLVDGLVALGYDAAICRSEWKKSKSSKCPAGDYEYLDVMIGGERVMIDIDFKSKFSIARPTKTYKSISQTLPFVFVGQVDRLKKIVVFVSEAAKKSLKKQGLFVPPWRRADFVLTKWLAPHVRAKQTQGETSGDDDGGGEEVEV